MKPDGTYSAVGRRRTPSSGTWSVNGDRVCLKQAKPFRAPMSYCTSFPQNGAVGATWTGKDMSGTPIRLKLVKGVQKPG